MINIFKGIGSSIVFFFSSILSLANTAYLVHKNNFYIEPIENIHNIQQVLWKSDSEIIFVSNSDIILYNLLSKEQQNIVNREVNEIVGLDSDNNLLFCRFENYVIYSKDEVATKFELYDYEHRLIKEISFFETIRPISIDSNTIIATTAVDFLEQENYQITVENGEIEKIEEVDIGRSELNTPLANWDIVIKNIHYGSNKQAILEDPFGNVYLYAQGRVNSNLVKRFKEKYRLF